MMLVVEEKRKQVGCQSHPLLRANLPNPVRGCARKRLDLGGLRDPY